MEVGVFPQPEIADSGASREISEVKEEERKMSIWTILFIILLIAWITGFSVFHVAGGLIHLLLVFAVISLILHFVMGRSAV
jgi:hypothetical protein